jgi:acetyltransferase-like isoleucine patch superfamily enzyme
MPHVFLRVGIGRRSGTNRTAYETVPSLLSEIGSTPVVIGDRSSVEEYTYLDAMDSVTVGCNVLVGPSCHITHANHVFRRRELTDKPGRRGRCSVDGR